METGHRRVEDAYSIVENAYRIPEDSYSIMENPYRIVENAYSIAENRYRRVENAYRSLILILQLSSAPFFLCLSSATHHRFNKA